MSSRGPMLVVIHSRNPFLDPDIRAVLTEYLYDDEPAAVMNGESDWLDEYRGSTGEELVAKLVEADPSICVEVSCEDPEYPNVTCHAPDLGTEIFTTLDSEIALTASMIEALLSDQPDDLPGVLDRLIGGPYRRAFAAIPRNHPNRLTDRKDTI